MERATALRVAERLQQRVPHAQQSILENSDYMRQIEDVVAARAQLAAANKAELKVCGGWFECTGKTGVAQLLWI